MIKHAWTVLCQKVIVDKESNNMSLDVIEQIQLAGTIPPGEDQDAQGLLVPYQLTIASLWYRSAPDHPERGEAKLKVLAPDEEILVTQLMNLDLTQKSGCRTICKMSTLPIPKGSHNILRFVVELEVEGNWKEVAEIPLEITCNWTEETQADSLA